MVNFFSKPINSKDANLKQNVVSTSSGENYITQISIKKDIHEGDLYAIAISEKYIAIGGLDNKISFWSSLSGKFISVIELPKFVDNKLREVFVAELQFLKSKSNFLLVLQNTGDLHIAHPASSGLIKP